MFSLTLDGAGRQAAGDDGFAGAVLLLRAGVGEGGDEREGCVTDLPGEPLPQSLEVGVFNWRWPVPGGRWR